MFGFPNEAVGAVVAAIVAGVVALLGLIISKEQKVSEFRQQWIDALRADIAAVIRFGHCMYHQTLAKTTGQLFSPDDFREDFAGLTEAAARIRLRLNRREPESAALLAALDKHFATLRNESDFEALSAATDVLVAASQVVLKQEWRRVRSGELVYRIARFAALLFIVVLAIALMYHVFRK